MPGESPPRQPRSRPALPAPATPSEEGLGSASNAAPALAMLRALRQDGSRPRSQKQDLSGSRKSGSQWTRRGREMDSNFRFPREDRVSSLGLLLARDRGVGADVSVQPGFVIIMPSPLEA